MSETLLAEARRELGRLPVVLDALLAGLDEAGARTRPAPGEWSPVEIVCHLRDEETEDFGARLRVIVNDVDEFAPIDPERWAEERRYGEESLPVVLDRPGGVVHSDREIRLTVPASAEQQHAVEFGVLRGLLELVEPARLGGQAKHSAATAAPSKKSWYHKLFA